jgi:hypothetical protein
MKYIRYNLAMSNLLRSLSDEFYLVRSQIQAGPLDVVKVSVPLHEVAYYHELLDDDVVVFRDDRGQLNGACILGLRCGKEFVIAGSKTLHACWEEERRGKPDPEDRATDDYILALERLLLAPTNS